MIRFIHIPKNAGTTVVKMLARNHIPFRVGHPAQQHTRHRFCSAFGDGLPTLAIVRHPLTRVVSHWQWIRRHPSYRDLSFERFVCEKYSRGRARLAWQPQWLWTHCARTQQQLVTHLVRYEHLREQLCQLFPTLGGKWLHLNSGGIVNHMAHHTEQTRRIVLEHFARDLELFGYTSSLLASEGG